MARFEALTTNVLDLELELLREQLGLEPSQKAELLGEVAALAAWVVRQAGEGRSVEAHRNGEVETLMHPALDRFRAQGENPIGEHLALRDEEVTRLAAVLDGGFEPPSALRRALANLAEPKRRPPRVRWRKSPG
jgi:hypothetical protein